MRLLQLMPKLRLYFNSDVGEIYKEDWRVQDNRPHPRSRLLLTGPSRLLPLPPAPCCQNHLSSRYSAYPFHKPASEIVDFESEVGILQSLKHPHIVELVDFKKTQKHFYIFLEYCEGGNLADYIRDRQTLP